MAESGRDAHNAFDYFSRAYQAKNSKAVECLKKEGGGDLRSFSDFPAEQWIRIPTTDPIESTFSTVCHRPVKPEIRLPREHAGNIFKLHPTVERLRTVGKLRSA